MTVMKGMILQNMFIILSLDLLATELMKILLNMLNDRLHYALILFYDSHPASFSLFYDSEQSNLEYQPKVKRNTMSNRTKMRLLSVTNPLWTKIETMIVDLHTKCKPRHYGMLGHKSM